MATLTNVAGQGYLIEGDDVIALTPQQYQQQIESQQSTQDRSGFGVFTEGVGKSLVDMASGVRQLTYGDTEQEQQYRAQQQQDYAPVERYGGAPGAGGEMFGSAATAIIPGGRGAQLGIGTAQGAAERPDTPILGGAIGFGSTLLGDWVGQTLGRMGGRLMARRKQLEPTELVTRGEDAGLEFTPGQRSGDRQRRAMEMEISKNPRLGGANYDRFARNQARLNDLAAETLGLPPTGRVTDDMRNVAYDKAKAGFSFLDDYDGPVQMDTQAFEEMAGDLTDSGKIFYEKFAERFSGVMDGTSNKSGKSVLQARNWLAKQSRAGANQTAGIGDEIQDILAVLDNSVESSVDEITSNEVRRARQLWKAQLIVDDAFGGGGNEAAGNISALSAHRALKKYDKRQFTYGRNRDPFRDAVKAMAGLQDSAPAIRPSGPGLPKNPADWLGELINMGVADSYLKGGPTADMLMGISREAGADIPLRAAGRGVARGLMAPDDEPELMR